MRRLGRSLSIREVDAGSCNGCELEIHALSNAFYDLDIQSDRLVLTRLRFQPMQPLGRDVEVTAGTLED